MWNSIEISLGNLTYNLKQIKKFLSPGTKIMAIVKADAYGHGLIPVSKRLEKLGVECLGVNDFEEGMALRAAKVKKPVIVLQGVLASECRGVVENDLTPIVYRLAVIQKLDREAKKLGKVQKVHLKIDTGMGRIGILNEDLKDVLLKIKNMKGVEIEGLCSHFSSADEKDKAYTMGQLKRFEKAVELAESLGVKPRYKHIANSAAIINYKESHFNMVRPGILLYGSAPSAEIAKKISLKPLMRFKSRIAQIKETPAGWGVSYNRTCVLPKKKKIAVVPVGYSNGYPRLLSGKQEVLIGGKREKILGNVCMNALMVDLTSFPSARAGDEVVLLGGQSGNSILAEELAQKAGTISYEIYCLLGGRNQRKWIKS